MRIKFLLTIGLLLAIQLLMGQGIVFEELGLEEAFAKSKKSGKLVFVFGYAEWSQPAALMDNYTLTDAEVGLFFNLNFIPVRLDLESNVGEEVADYYGVTGYPALLFINSEGVLIHKGCGAMESGTILAMAEEALGPNNLKQMIDRYENGERSPQFLSDLSSVMFDACMSTEVLADDYFEELPVENWTDSASWTMLNLNVTNLFAEPFQYLLRNRTVFEELYGKDTIDAKVHDVFLDQLIGIYEEEDQTMFAILALRHLMKAEDFTGKSQVSDLLELKRTEMIGDWSAYGELVPRVIVDQEVADPDQLNEFAWKLYLYVDEEEVIQEAINWMYPVVESFPLSTYLDTYASLLHKMGDQKQAVKYAKKALKAAKLDEENDDLAYYEGRILFFQENE